MWQSTQVTSASGSWCVCSTVVYFLSPWHCVHWAGSRPSYFIAHFRLPCIVWQWRQLISPLRKHALWLCVEPVVVEPRETAVGVEAVAVEVPGHGDVEVSDERIVVDRIPPLVQVVAASAGVEHLVVVEVLAGVHQTGPRLVLGLVGELALVPLRVDRAGAVARLARDGTLEHRRSVDALARVVADVVVRRVALSAPEVEDGPARVEVGREVRRPAEDVLQHGVGEVPTPAARCSSRWAARATRHAAP